jgi:hypothetical protein
MEPRGYILQGGAQHRFKTFDLKILNGEAKNRAASNRMRGFFASLKMTSVVGSF